MTIIPPWIIAMIASTQPRLPYNQTHHDHLADAWIQKRHPPPFGQFVDLQKFRVTVLRVESVETLLSSNFAVAASKIWCDRQISEANDTNNNNETKISKKNYCPS